MKTLAIFLPLLASSVFANDSPPPQTPETKPPIASQEQVQEQEQIQIQGQEQTLNSNQNAFNSANSNATSSNNQSISYEYRTPGSLAQGSLMIGDCGAGVNGGGSNTNGAGFLGITWTPEDCKLILAAKVFIALGMYDSACEMTMGISAVQARWKDIKKLNPNFVKPSCEIKPPTTQVEKQVDMSQYVRKDEQVERDRKMIQTLSSK